jgi:hypothetical protein
VSRLARRWRPSCSQSQDGLCHAAMRVRFDDSTQLGDGVHEVCIRGSVVRAEIFYEIKVFDSTTGDTHSDL